MPKGGATNCTMLAAVPVLPVGYVVIARRIADRTMILAVHRLADLSARVTRKRLIEVENCSISRLSRERRSIGDNTGNT